MDDEISRHVGVSQRLVEKCHGTNAESKEIIERCHKSIEEIHRLLDKAKRVNEGLASLPSHLNENYVRA
jgi:hypothetical protein